MFRIDISDKIRIELLDDHHAEDLFNLCIKNKEHLNPWLPWIVHVNELKDTMKFIKDQKNAWANNQGLECVTFFEDTLCGTIGFNKIDNLNSSGNIGYWLDQDHQGKGIVVSCVQKMIEIGFHYLNRNRIVIQADVNNHRSQAVPKKLGFTLEGTLRNNQYVNGNYVDHYLFSLLKKEFLQNQTTK